MMHPSILRAVDHLSLAISAVIASGDEGLARLIVPAIDGVREVLLAREGASHRQWTHASSVIIDLAFQEAANKQE